MSEKGKLRLQVYLSRCDLGSRRLCEKLISGNRVTVNGINAVVGVKVGEGDRVCVDGKPVKPSEQSLYIALNKPSGYLCTNADPFGRPLAVDLLRKSLRNTKVFHVGRLDFNSSGLIFYTNDGQFAQSVAHPSMGIRKTYLVETSKRINEGMLKQYKRGVAIGAEKYRLSTYRIEAERRCRLVLIEGKNREIRNVFDHFGHKIKAIRRIKIGVVSIRALKSGESRLLTKSEVSWFLARLTSN
jgi:23S rRNA pseudouridine2605 synthase